jgi:CheY-like chemotaxis protein
VARFLAVDGDEESSDGSDVAPAKTLPRRSTVLVVDDDASVRESLEGFLTKAGYDVHLVANGGEALESVKASTPDVIVLDLLMPVMSGFEVLIALRANKSWARIPVVVVTADAGHLAARLNVRATLVKPFNMIDVQASIRLALAGKQRASR